MTSLWAYLAKAYATPAFQESCPSDMEILMRYQRKVKAANALPMRRIIGLKEHRSLSIEEEE